MPSARRRDASGYGRRVGAEGAVPVAPRIGVELDGLADPVVEDDVEWSGVEVTGDLGGAVGCDVEVDGSRLRCALTGATLDRLRLTDVVIEDGELSGAMLDEAILTRVEVRGCRMSGLVLSRAKLWDVVFVRCRMDEASFRMVKAERVVFDECDLRRADFYDASLPGAVLRRCDLTEVELSRADLRGARLHGSTLLDLRGAGSLTGAVIDPSQVVPLSASLLAALEITVDDDLP
jgi:hypothetical protein